MQLNMLENAHPDAVHICTPHYLHTQMILSALERNIHVLCEKPLCIRKEDIPVIIAAQKKSQAQLGVCLQNRYLPQNAYVKKLLENKKILDATGKMIWHRDAAYYRSAAWRGKWATEGGGVLINQALHTLDLLQYFVGMPSAVSATVSNFTLQEEIEAEDTASLICYGERSNFTFFATNGGSIDQPVEIEIYTEKERIRILSDGVLIGERFISFRSLEQELGKHCYGSGHKALIRDFYDCLESSKKFQIDAEEAAKVVKIVLSAYESKGRKIKIEDFQKQTERL